MKLSAVNCASDSSFVQKSGGAVCEFTENMRYIRQYFRLRKEGYDRESFDKQKGLMGQGRVDHNDFNGQILVVRFGEEVVGGARLVMHSKDRPVKLPLEGEGLIDIRKFLPSIINDDTIFAEAGRITVKPEYRNPLVSRLIYKCWLEKCYQENCRYIIGIAPSTQVRMYRKGFREFGVELEIRDDLSIPSRETHEAIKMHLVMGDLKYYNPQLVSHAA